MSSKTPGRPAQMTGSGLVLTKCALAFPLVLFFTHVPVLRLKLSSGRLNFIVSRLARNAQTGRQGWFRTFVRRNHLCPPTMPPCRPIRGNLSWLTSCQMSVTTVCHPLWSCSAWSRSCVRRSGPGVARYGCGRSLSDRAS